MLLRHPHAAPRNALQRKMAGGGAQPSEPAGRGPRRLAAEPGGVCSASLSPRPLEESLPEASGPPRLLPPTATAIGEPRRPRGCRWQAPARGREGFNPFGIWPCICPCLSPHPSPQGHLLLLVTPALSLHSRDFLPALRQQQVAGSSASAGARLGD